MSIKNGKFARTTRVSPDQTQIEIRNLLEKHGASGWGILQEENIVIICFKLNSRLIRMNLTLPVLSDYETRSDGAFRSKENQKQAYEQAIRTSWRELLLIIKAKLEAVATGIVSLEDEFLPYMQLQDGRTIKEWLEPQIRNVFEGNNIPLLPGGRS